MDKIIYYQKETDDVVVTRHQDFQLPADFVWQHSSRLYRWTSRLLGRIWSDFAWFYCRLRGIELVNRKALDVAAGSGMLVVANHTQPFGDVVTPFALLGRKRRVRPIAQPANLGIPVIGRLLPIFGVLVTPHTTGQFAQFLSAVQQALAAKEVVFVYPEAHVWPYYTGIRDFPATAFRFAVEAQVPVFTATSTYQNVGKKKPKQVIYLDGPFYVPSHLPRKAAQQFLREKSLKAMRQRSERSNQSYTRYVKRKEN